MRFRHRRSEPIWPYVPAPESEKVLVLPGLASTTTFTKGQLNMRIIFEMGMALILIIGGFVLGQPVYGIILGLVALGAGYIIYLLRSEIR
jgi:hypothetical protein